MAEQGRGLMQLMHVTAHHTTESFNRLIRVAQQGGVPPLVALLSSSSENIQILALAALRIILECEVKDPFVGFHAEVIKSGALAPLTGRMEAAEAALIPLQRRAESAEAALLPLQSRADAADAALLPLGRLVEAAEIARREAETALLPLRHRVQAAEAARGDAEAALIPLRQHAEAAEMARGVAEAALLPLQTG